MEHPIHGLCMTDSLMYYYQPFTNEETETQSFVQVIQLVSDRV